MVDAQTHKSILNLTWFSMIYCPVNININYTDNTYGFHMLQQEKMTAEYLHFKYTLVA